MFTSTILSESELFFPKERFESSKLFIFKLELLFSSFFSSWLFSFFFERILELGILSSFLSFFSSAFLGKIVPDLTGSNWKVLFSSFCSFSSFSSLSLLSSSSLFSFFFSEIITWEWVFSSSFFSSLTSFFLDDIILELIGLLLIIVSSFSLFSSFFFFEKTIPEFKFFSSLLDIDSASLILPSEFSSLFLIIWETTILPTIVLLPLSSTSFLGGIFWLITSFSFFSSFLSSFSFSSFFWISMNIVGLSFCINSFIEFWKSVSVIEFVIPILSFSSSK